MRVDTPTSWPASWEPGAAAFAWVVGRQAACAMLILLLLLLPLLLQLLLLLLLLRCLLQMQHMQFHLPNQIL